MIQLFASDLDGTLLLNHSQTLPPSICEQIRCLHQKGICFAAASGRQYHNLRRLFAPVADDIAYICENGALICYQNQILHRSVIERSLGQEILRTILHMEGCEALLSGTDTCYIQPKTSAYSHHMYYVVRNRTQTVTDLTKVSDAFIKISLYEPDGYRPETEALLRNRFGSQVTLVTSGNGWLDIMAKDTNKGTAMHKLSQALQIPLSNIAAIGDNLNDIEMLSCVGYPVCVQSAHPAVLDICPIHTVTVEQYLRQFI